MPRIRSFGDKKQTADPSVRENKKKASSHLQGGETIVVREGNRKDVPSEMRNGFVRLFVCLFVRGVALRASTKLWRGVRGGCLYLCSGAYIIVFGQFFDLEGGYLKRVMKNSSSKKFCHRSVGPGAGEKELQGIKRRRKNFWSKQTKHL